LTFCEVNNEKIIAYLKHIEGNTLLVVINLDPWDSQSGMLNFPLNVIGFGQDQAYNLHDLMTDTVYSWTGAQNYVELSASAAPVHIFRVF
jgi:starch synthase (maltosyl-transferring)